MWRRVMSRPGQLSRRRAERWSHRCWRWIRRGWMRRGGLTCSSRWNGRLRCCRLPSSGCSPRWMVPRGWDGEVVDYTAEQVGAALRLSPGTAGHRLEVARILVDRLPATLGLLERGEITYLHAPTRSHRSTTRPPERSRTAYSLGLPSRPPVSSAPRSAVPSSPRIHAVRSSAIPTPWLNAASRSPRSRTGWPNCGHCSPPRGPCW